MQDLMNENSFSQNVVLDISQDERKICVMAKQDDISINCAYTFESFVSINTFFLEFESLKEILEMMKKSLQNNRFKLSKSLKYFELYFPISIPILQEGNPQNIEEEILNKRYKAISNHFNKLFKLYSNLQKDLRDRRENQLKKESIQIKNFNFKNIQVETIIKEKNQIFTCATLVENSKLACGCNNEIKILNLDGYNCEQVLRGHKGNLTHITTLDNGYIMSSSSDTTIKIWEVNKRHHQCIKTITYYKTEVSLSIQLSCNRIASCSGNYIILFQSFYPYSIIESLNFHENYVVSIVEVKNGKYFVSAEGSSLYFWDSLTYQCRKVLKDIYCPYKYSLVSTSDNKIIVQGRAGRNNYIYIINALTFKKENEINVSNSGNISAFIEIAPSKILWYTQKETFGYFDIGDPQQLSVRKNLVFGIFGVLLVKDARIVTISFDSLVFWRCKG